MNSSLVTPTGCTPPPGQLPIACKERCTHLKTNGRMQLAGPRAQVLERRQGLNFRVNMKSRGDTFGEVSLMYNVPRSATVAATRESVVWVLERELFRCLSRLLFSSFAIPCSGALVWTRWEGTPRSCGRSDPVCEEAHGGRESAFRHCPAHPRKLSEPVHAAICQSASAEPSAAAVLQRWTAAGADGVLCRMRIFAC